VPSEPDDEPVRLTDARAIRALAHPARLAVIDALRNQGRTLTATEAAEVAGLSPSAMSYHLRALAKWGIVREAESDDASDGRERRWQRAGAGFQFDPPAHGAEAATAFIASHYLDETRAQLSHYLTNQARENDFWRENAVMSYREAWLTEEQALEVGKLAGELLEAKASRDDNRPPGARRVRMTFLMFPIDAPDDAN
jgi:DNA-binding transcriptional ArsR family regulator